MSSIDCQTARALFSEHQDRRLAAEPRAHLLGHIDSCPPCRARWRLYAAVFDGVARLPELSSGRAFRRPPEPPGRDDRRFVRLSWTPRRAAAGILILLGLTHLAVFEWARRGGGEELPAAPSEVGAVSASAPAAVEAGFFGQRVRDHVEAADVLSRQIAQMPAQAGEEARQLVGAQLEILRPDALIESAERLASPKDETTFAYQSYLHAWNGLTGEIERGLAAQAGPRVVGWLQDRLDRSAVPEAMLAVRLHVADEPVGRTWQALDWKPVFSRVNAVGQPAGDVQLFLGAQREVLRARYSEAQAAFQAFRRVHPASHLVPLATYMEADCLRRVGYCEQATLLLLEGQGIQLRCLNIVRRDPLATSFLIARSIPPVVLSLQGLAPEDQAFPRVAPDGGTIFGWDCPVQGPMGVEIRGLRSRPLAPAEGAAPVDPPPASGSTPAKPRRPR